VYPQLDGARVQLHLDTVELEDALGRTVGGFCLSNRDFLAVTQAAQRVGLRIEMSTCDVSAEKWKPPVDPTVPKLPLVAGYSKQQQIFKVPHESAPPSVSSLTQGFSG
jgi:hypothetical protein